METFGNNFTPKNAEFCCISCDFKCSKQSDWKRHVETKKHIHRHNGNKMESFGNNFTPKNAAFICVCGKSYTSRAGLYKHEKKCANYAPDVNVNSLIHLVKQLVKENADLKTVMIDNQNKFFEQTSNFTQELVKNGIYNNSHNTINNNSNNKAFNLNFFLNETCKNAMNISDFVDSIKLQLSDLIKVGELGYVEGISNIIVKNLNALDETERPIHCTDKKRETIYIKDQNRWEKDDEHKKKLRKVIDKVALKNQRLLPQYKEKYPDYNDSESKNSDKYSKLVIEALGGSGDNDRDKEDKIIKNITKEVFVDK